MTSQELFNEIRPIRQQKYSSQINHGRLNFNYSGMFTTLIRDAARCNNYSSDVYYNLNDLKEAFDNYNPDQEPIWIGFRKLGVDHTNYVLLKVKDAKYVYSALSSEYFALYSVSFEPDEEGWCNVIFSEYGV